MPVYIMLFKFTDQGIKAVKESPARANAGNKALEASSQVIVLASDE